MRKSQTDPNLLGLGAHGANHQYSEARLGKGVSAPRTRPRPFKRRAQFDPSIISFETLLEVFFTVHDPTQLNRQGNDIGTQYRSCIMPLSEEQRATAEAMIADMGNVYDDPIVTTLEEPLHFLIAEKKHHDYYARNPYQGYCAAVVGPKIAKVRAKHAHLYR